MTTRSKDELVCECGHRGFLCLSENDAPFSSLWEHYTFEVTITSYADQPSNIIEALHPKCPECGKAGNVKRL